MLQIITGKFFKSDRLYVTRQRGILYSNYRLPSEWETPVGTLKPTETWRDVASMIYEVDQRLERGEGEGFGLVAVSADHLLQDFSAVLSFALNMRTGSRPSATAHPERARSGRVITSP